MDKRSFKILALLCTSPRGFNEIARLLSMSKKTVLYKLRELSAHKPPLVRKEGSKGSRGRWCITNEGKRVLFRILENHRWAQEETLNVYIEMFLTDYRWKKRRDNRRKEPTIASWVLFYIESGLHFILGVLINDILSGKRSSEECLEMLFRDNTLRKILSYMFEEVEKSRKYPSACLMMLVLSEALKYPIISAFLMDLERYTENHRYRCKELKEIIKKVARNPVNIEYCEVKVD